MKKILFTLFIAIFASNCFAMDVPKLDPKECIAAKELYESKVLKKELEKFILGGKRVLELDCGFGQNVEMLNNDFELSCVVGIDEDQSMIDYAKKTYKSDNIIFQCLELNKFSELNSQEMVFDLIFSSFALTKINKAQHQEVFEKCYDMINPSGGLLILMRAKQAQDHPFYAVMKGLAAIEEYQELIGKMAQQSEQMFTVNEYKHMLHEVGFDVTFAQCGVVVRDEPIQFNDIAQFQRYMDVTLKWHYPILAQLPTDTFKVLSEAVRNKYCEVMKDRDSSFDPNKPFAHPYKFLVMKVAKSA